jgi:hypothetical protein
MAEADQFFTRNPLLVSVIGLDQAVLRLAPPPNSPEVGPLQDLITKTLLRPPEISENQPPDRLFEREDSIVAARFWSNRETAITRIHKALCDGVLSALVRDPDTGRFVQLVGAQWRDAALCHETILCGQICARPGEDIARYDAWAVVLETAAFDRRMADILPATSPTVTALSETGQIDQFKTGGPGRPTARDIICREFSRRLDAGEVTPEPKKLTNFGEATMWPWWEAKRVELGGPPVTSRVMANMLRGLWRAAISSGNR